MARHGASLDTKATIARNVRKRRLAAGFTQLDLAVEAGVAAGTIYWAERSGRATTSTLEKIAKALRCKPAALLS